MKEITQERASQILKMMLFLRDSGKYYITSYKCYKLPVIELYSLYTTKGKLIANLDHNDDKFYIREAP